MGLFGKSAPPDPKEQVKEWSKKLRKERNALDRQINQIKREEQKAVNSIRQSAKKNDTTSAKILAREVVNARKAVTRITTAKAQINSVELQMQQQASQIRVVGALQKSTDVMKSMSNLIKVPEVHQVMQEMSREMMKAGVIEEMMEDTFEAIDDPEELEEDVQQAVDKILSEITMGVKDKMAKAPQAPDASIALPELPDKEDEQVAAETEAAEADEEMAEMQSRLAMLRS